MRPLNVEGDLYTPAGISTGQGRGCAVLVDDGEARRIRDAGIDVGGGEIADNVGIVVSIDDRDRLSGTLILSPVAS